jgi:hypothetical protein
MCAFEKSNTFKPLIRYVKMFHVIPFGQNGATHHETSHIMQIIIETLAL